MISVSEEQQKRIVLFVALSFTIATAFSLAPATVHAAPTSYYTYNDTVLVVNDASATSTTIANYFMQARGLTSTWATTHVVHLSASTPTAESISLSDFTTYIRNPIQNFLIANHIASSTNYIITTKGVPLKIGGTASVDQEISLILGKYSSLIGNGTGGNNPYDGENEPFSSTKFGFYLVTRLTGYTIPQVEALINRSDNATTTNAGQIVLDTQPAKAGTAYDTYNVFMENAAPPLIAKGYTVNLDKTITYLTYQKNVLGYYSWGSNDGHSTTTLSGWTEAQYLFSTATTTLSVGLSVQATTTPGHGIYPRNTPNGSVIFGLEIGNKGTIIAGPQTAGGNTWWQVAYVTGSIPHNTYVNGAIGDTAVSSSGRSFTYPPVYGQSLVADLIKDGISGVAGYTSEPYLSAVSRPDILFDRYTSGYNLADSFFMAFHDMNWKQVVVGDPKMVIVKHLPFYLSTPVENDITSSTTVTFSWTAQQNYYGVNKYQLYIDGALAKDNITGTSTTLTLSQGSPTWYVKAIGNEGPAATSTSTYTINIVPGYTQNHTFYVDNLLGNDNNIGSQSSPWKTLKKAGDTARAGNTVILIDNPGHPYRETLSTKAGTSAHRITFEGADPLHKAEIWGSTDESGGWALDSGGPADTYQKDILTRNVVGVLASGPSISNLTSRTGATSVAILLPGQWYFDSINNLLYYRLTAGENINTLHIEAGQREIGILGKHYNTFQDINVRYVNGNGVIGLTTGSIVNRVGVYGSEIGFFIGGGGNLGGISGPALLNSLAIDNSGSGIMILASLDATVYHNLAYGNNRGLYVLINATGSTIKDNIFAHNNISVSFFVFSSVKNFTASHNAWAGPTSSSWKTYQGTHNLASTTPLFIATSTNNFSLTQFSPLVDAGTAVSSSTATDFLGNPIYGTPDIGPFEYQPPYTMGINHPTQGAPLRLYENGRYRYLSATSTSDTVPLTVTPAAGFTPKNYSKYLDITIQTWSTDKKVWTESSSQAGATTINTAGDFAPNKDYNVFVDGTFYTTKTTNASGVLSFTYPVGYKHTRTFTITARPSAGFVPVFMGSSGFVSTPNPLPIALPKNKQNEIATSTINKIATSTATTTSRTTHTHIVQTRSQVIRTIQTKLVTLLSELVGLLEKLVAAQR